MTSEHILVRKNTHSKFHSDTPSDNFALPGYHLEVTLACPPKSQNAIVAKDGLSWNSLLKICKQILVVTTITGMGDNPKDNHIYHLDHLNKGLFCIAHLGKDSKRIKPLKTDGKTPPP